MTELTILARLFLAVVFAVAAVGKLTDHAGARRSVAEFGVPRPLVGPVARSLPLVELAVAAALLPPATVAWAAGAAIVLLSSFTLAMAVNLARGKRPTCRCFGQLNATPVTWRSLARNGVLILPAVLVAGTAVEGPVPALTDALSPESLPWIADLLAAAALAAVVIQAVVILNLVSAQGRMMLRLDALEGGGSAVSALGLPVGTPAPELDLPTTAGGVMTLAELRAPGLPILLVFTEPSCHACAQLLPEVARWQREQRERLTIAVVGVGSGDSVATMMAAAGLPVAAVGRDHKIFDAFGVQHTPGAVLVDPAGTVASPVAVGTVGVTDLVARAALGTAGAVGHGAPSSGPQIGDVAPALVLPDLSGSRFDLAQDVDGDALVLFWDTGCPHCAAMLPELREWASQAPADAPRLVVVSRGDVEANRAMGLEATVLTDESGSARTRWGVDGTPMALLVDGDGTVASPVVTGAGAVLSLAKRDRGSDIQKADGGAKRVRARV